MYFMKNLGKNQKEKPRQRSCDIAGSSWSAQSTMESSDRQRVVELEEFEHLVFHSLRATERSSLPEPAVEITQISLKADQVSVIGYEVRLFGLDVAKSFLHCPCHGLTPFWSRLSASQDYDDMGMCNQVTAARSFCCNHSIIDARRQAQTKTSIPAVLMA